MNTAERLKCLQADIDKLVERYGRECVRHKKAALTLKITSVLLAALITIFLGLKFQDVAVKDMLSNLALVLGAVITVISAYEAFFDPRSLWVRETVAFARLKDLQRDLRFWASGIDPQTADSQALDVFKRKLDQILDDSLKYWMKIRGAPEVDHRVEEKGGNAR